MANKKFSEFTEKTQESEVGKLVGLSADGTTNIQIDPTKIADFTSFSIETTPAGASYIVGLNAAGTQRIKISPDDLVNFSGFSLETTSSGVSYIVGLNAAGNTKIKISPDDLINFNNYPTETYHQNIGFLAGVNLNGDKVKIAQNKVGKSTFTGGVWNGLTYYTVTSPRTGKVWLDRNIGATQVATSATDSNSFGFLFQFGRSADNHQFRNSATTTTQEVSETNTSSNFVLNSNTWSANLSNKVWLPDWEGKAMNDVCPPGFRIPTPAEVTAEFAGFSSGNLAGAFSSFLKISASEIRDNYNGSITNYGHAYLWQSNQSIRYISATGHGSFSGPINHGCGVRPIKI